MLDFSALPPEVNSGRMYAGAGAGPLIAAASAWDTLAAELHTAATGYGSVVSELTAGWRGPSSSSMTAAAAPYVAWLHHSSTTAEQTAAQAKAAAAAYELAFAMTVPPPVIAANRSLLLTLIATNVFGQNTPAIAAAEAHYAEMWLQDATAMYGYAGSSSAASRLPPFTEPPPTTDPSGPAAQSVAVAHAVSHPATTPPSTSAPTWVDYLEHVPNLVNSVMSNTSALVSGRGIAIVNARLAFQAAQQEEADGGSGGRLVAASRARGPVVSAVIGRAALIGSLPVPPNWAIAAPDIRLTALTLPNPVTAVTADTPPIPGNAFSQSVLGTLSRRGFDEPRPKTKPVIVRSPAAG